MNSASFTINLIGDVTQEKFLGSFKVKTRLSHRDHLEKDRRKRELLGPDSASAAADAKALAEIISQLSVRITEAPVWWTGSNGGMDLEDDNVLGEVYQQAIKAESDALTELKKKAAEAAKELAEPVK